MGGWTARLPRREDQLFLALTLIIGVLVGLAVVGFIVLTERSSTHLFPAGGAGWMRLLVPTLGALVAGVLLARFFPNARGSGVPQTKTALFARDGRITLRTVVGKFLCTSISLSSGIPLGREGPSVQVGAGIASVLGRGLGLSREKVQALIPVGASAAIAAAFNTPLAAVLFSLEEVMGDLHAPMLGSVVLSSAASWITLRLSLGNEPLFHVPPYSLGSPIELAFYLALGCVGGLVSAAFVKVLLALRARFLNLPRRTQIFQPVVGGLLVGIVALFVPQVLGVGYRSVGDALSGSIPVQLMLLLVILKLLTVATAYASGNAGGIFAPALFMGAMLGGVFGTLANLALPSFAGAPGAYALVGMGALFAGIIRAPMTSVIMIFELTHDYAIIVPLMVSNLVSFYISYRLQRTPIYEALQHQEGIHLPAHETRRQHGERRVLDVMRAAPELLEAGSTVAEAIELSHASPFRAWPVVEADRLLGTVSLVQLERARAGPDDSAKVGALVDRGRFPHVHPDQPLELALDRMGRAKLDVLPVVSRVNIRKLEGVVTLRDVLAAYGVGDEQGH